MMENRNCIVTGANSGIGKVTALELAQKGANVIMVCRNNTTGEETQKNIIEKSGNKNVYLYIYDLSIMKEVKKAAQEIQKKHPVIDALINNAGVSRKKRIETEEGFETTIAVNHFAVVLLSELLLKNLKKSQQGRIINVNSALHRYGNINLNNLMLKKGYSTLAAYSNSKLINLAYSIDMAEQLKDTSVTVNAIHPGVVGTSINRDWPLFLVNFLNLFFLSPEDGAKPQIALASDEKFTNITGKYFKRDRESKPNGAALNGELRKQVVNKTQELLNIYLKK